MPFGLWKSKWEIHREDMVRREVEESRRRVEWREEMDARHAVWQKEMDARHAEWQQAMDARRAESQKAMDARQAEWQREMDARQAKWDREAAEARKLDREILARIDKNHEELKAILENLTNEVVATRREVVLLRKETADAIGALTEAVLGLIDRFDEFEGRSPGRAA